MCVRRLGVLSHAAGGPARHGPESMSESAVKGTFSRGVPDTEYLAGKPSRVKVDTVSALYGGGPRHGWWMDDWGACVCKARRRRACGASERASVQASRPLLLLLLCVPAPVSLWSVRRRPLPSPGCSLVLEGRKATKCQPGCEAPVSCKAGRRRGIGVRRGRLSRWRPSVTGSDPLGIGRVCPRL